MSNNTPWWDTDTPHTPNDPWWDTPKKEPIDPPMPQKDSPHRLEGGAWTLLLEWVKHNRYTAIYMAIGLFLAVGILNIGFWRTFLVAFFIGSGYVLGSWQDGNPKLIRRMKHFTTHFIEDNPFMNNRN